VSASPEVVWKVLTDYENLPKFLPNVISNKVLSNNGDRKIVEQVNSRQVLFIKVKSRIRTAIAETRQNRIDFQQIDGDLQQMQGYWLIEPVAPYKGAKADRVLITQIIEAQPKEGTPKDIFYDIFQNSLGETLNAIAKEINRRTTNSAAN
jgi:ribosome-associated toxin RatA of RatAB toxin-antitoxin module